MTRLLAFDTSTDAMSIALLTPHGLQVRDAEGGPLASARLLPELQSMLDAAGVAYAQLDAIAFGCGPGAFTGLRTACSVAQGLAFGAGKPVVLVDSLMLVAQDARHQQPQGLPDELWVAMDARMDEVYAGAYRWTGDAWAVTNAPALYSLEALHTTWREAVPQAVCGSALDAFGDRLDTGTARRLPGSGSRARAVAAVAQQRWAQGHAVDALHALPVYLRDKVALTTREREAVRLAKGTVA